MLPDMRLTAEQKEIIDELVQNALAKAVQSMEKMLKIRVTSSVVNFGLGPVEEMPEFDQLGRFKVHLVKMVFGGDIHGAFYFIINDHEVDLINSVCLPEELKSEKLNETKIMKHGFMSELENVIAALSINEISEYMGVNLELKVPQVQIVPGTDVNKFLEKENKIHKTAFHVKAVLEGMVVNIAPIFIWVLDENFIRVLRLNTSA